MVLTGINTVQNNNPELVDGVQAGAAQVNQAGGLKGHPLVIVPCSTQSSQSVAIQCAQEAVSGGVSDMIEAEAFDQSTIPIVAAAGIPHVASPIQNPNDFFTRNWFPATSPSAAQAVAAVEATMKADPVKTWEGFVGQTSSGAALLNVVKEAVLKLHGTWLGAVSVPSTSTDETAAAESIHQSGAANVFIDISPGPADALISSAASLGIGAKYYATVATVLGVPDLESFPVGINVIIGAELPPSTANSPGMKMFRAAISAAGFAGNPVALEEDGSQGWLDMWALKDLSERVKGAVTSASLVKAAQAVTAKDPINVEGLVSWTPGVKGPAAFPNVPSGLAYMLKATTGPTASLSLIANKPVNAWTILGLR
jgi:ABC-type branched-subunit amino acid transport system substrate-binding protein